MSNILQVIDQIIVKLAQYGQHTPQLERRLHSIQSSIIYMAPEMWSHGWQLLFRFLDEIFPNSEARCHEPLIQEIHQLVNVV